MFWGLYNEVDIPVKALTELHLLAKKLDPQRMTTQADNDKLSERYAVTDLASWNMYYRLYSGEFNTYNTHVDNVHKQDSTISVGISEYGAGGCVDQQKEKIERPNPSTGRFFPEQYQTYYHENVWENIKDRDDIWCKYIWNMFDFSWTTVKREAKPYINNKGLITHDRKTKKDAFYFYKANWSEQPVLYITNKRLINRENKVTTVKIYTNLDKVELFVNGKKISSKKLSSEIHIITWEDITLSNGENQINVIGYKGKEKYSDASIWYYNLEK